MNNIIDKKELVGIIEQALYSDELAIFAGAGLSVPSGYVNWKELLRQFSDSIGLNIDKEYDLISVAQYYKNSAQSKNQISQKLIQEFTKDSKDNNLLTLLTSMPIETFWTTNYDHLIEDNLKKAGKRVDIKIDNNDLSITPPNIDATVYKFHGDISRPYEAILTRDDYESFDKSHKLFIQTLRGDLSSKTFVFVGYSLNDPDIQQILSKIRLLIGENIRMHYCFRKNLTIDMFENSQDPESELEYGKIKQEHEINDLKRYGIHTILIEDYNEIDELFNQSYKLYLTNSVFIAGSCRNYGEWDEDSATEFLYLLGYKLIANEIIVGNGNIEGVGPQVINGVMTAINDKNLDISKYLKIKTLPLIKGSDKHIDSSAKKRFQDNMISEAGIVIFVFGNQYYDGTLSNSKGVLEDFDRAIKQNRFIIPVGSTGWSSLEVYQTLLSEIDKYSYLTPFLDKLLIEKDPEILSQTIIDCIKHIRDAYIMDKL